MNNYPAAHAPSLYFFPSSQQFNGHYSIQHARGRNTVLKTRSLKCKKIQKLYQEVNVSISVFSFHLKAKLKINSFKFPKKKTVWNITCEVVKLNWQELWNSKIKSHSKVRKLHWKESTDTVIDLAFLKESGPISGHPFPLLQFHSSDTESKTTFCW